MTLDSETLSRVLDDRFLQLILFATEKCNFRCTYCYEDFAHGPMRPDVVQGVKRLLDRRVEAGLRVLDLSWFGGEPLLALPVVLDVSGHARDLAARTSLRYAASMTTNGDRLTVDTCAQLVERGVRSFQISLDGWGEVHDRTRRRANGRGTFEGIWQNLLDLKASDLDFSVSVRVHCGPDNLEGVEQLVDTIDRDLRDPRFGVRFKMIEHLGGPNDGTFDTIGPRQARDVVARLTARLADPGQVSNDGIDSGYICYASRPNSLTVRADGSTGKCTVALTSARNRVGTLAADGTLETDQERFRFWIRGVGTGDAATLACPAHVS